MSDAVTRLPVQHPKRPHCPTCGADMPTFDGVIVTSPVSFDMRDATLIATIMIFRVRCACGAVWDIQKGMKL